MEYNKLNSSLRYKLLFSQLQQFSHWFYNCHVAYGISYIHLSFTYYRIFPHCKIIHLKS